MPVSDIISATDYNTIRNKVINVLGTGSGNSGYGQTIQSSAVASGTIVTKAQWDALRFDLYNILYHQTGVTPALVQLSNNAVIRYGAGHPNNSYDTFADTAVGNRFDVGPGQYLTEARASRSRTDSWTSSVSCTVTVTFNTSNEARFFFNSGGKIRFTSQRTGGSGTAQNSAWSNVLSTAGTQSFGGNTPSINFYTLTSSPQTVYNLSSSSPYSANQYTITAFCNVSNNSAGTANVITFTVTWTDAYQDLPASPENPPPGDLVDGTLSLDVDQIRAYGNLQPSGIFTINQPSSVAISTITGS